MIFVADGKEWMCKNYRKYFAHMRDFIKFLHMQTIESENRMGSPMDTFHKP